MRFLISFFCAVAVFSATAGWADELTVYNYPSPGLDWSSPRALGRSIVRSYSRYTRALKGERIHPIGHVAVEVKCDSSEFGGARHFAAGMGPRDGAESVRVLFVQRQGMGVLFHDFKGKLDSSIEVVKDNSAHERMGKGMNFATFVISPQTCQRLAQYHREYIARGSTHHYGLPHRPRYGEGAGCSAYGVSYIELSGLLTEELKRAWSRTIRVQNSLIGGPLTGQKVPFSRIVSRRENTVRWAKPGEPQHSVFFYDPDLIYSWVNQVYERERRNPSGAVKLVTRGKIKGLQFDRRHVPTPAEPIWLR